MPISRRPLQVTWPDHVARWKDCRLCPLACQRDRIVLARGTVPCDVLFIGEAPGLSEDAIGLPFVGPAGKRMNEIIDQALPPGVTYAMTNLVCCLPREAKLFGDHKPTPDEIRACRPRLIEFVNLVRPRLIVCVGDQSSNWVPREDGVQYAEVVHPAAILRMPLAQKQMATQKSVVVIRNAVEDMLLSERRKFTDWRDDNAGIKSKVDDIPF